MFCCTHNLRSARLVRLLRIQTAMKHKKAKIAERRRKYKQRKGERDGGEASGGISRLLGIVERLICWHIG